MATSGFDRLAPYYDRIARLVFGETLYKAQICYLHIIPAGARVLILGGGTGRILEDIAAVHESGLQITYLESAPAMCEIARKRRCGTNTLQWVQADIAIHHLHASSFDVVLTPFILDCFRPDALGIICGNIIQTLRPGGLWLHTDFVNPPRRHLCNRALLWLMYRFFGLVTRIPADQLYPIDAYTAAAMREQKMEFMRGFVCAEVWRTVEA